jgi:hypothetical protein
MGIGIAADVYAATLASFRAFSDDNYLHKWVKRNTITHTLFPLTGMCLVVFGIAVWSPLQTILFGIGAFLLGFFLWNLVKEKAGFEDSGIHYTLAEKEENLLKKLENYLSQRVKNIDPQWFLVLGVSIDAINSGFAKAADTRDWSLLALLVSFPLVGLVVGAGAWAGGKKAKWFLSHITGQTSQTPEDLAKRLAILEYIALIIELFVLGYFFWRSIASAVIPLGVGELANSRIISWGASLIVTIIILILLGQNIFRNIKTKSKNSFDIKPDNQNNKPTI